MADVACLDRSGWGSIPPTSVWNHRKALVGASTAAWFASAVVTAPTLVRVENTDGMVVATTLTFHHSVSRTGIRPAGPAVTRSPAPCGSPSNAERIGRDGRTDCSP